MIGTIVKLLFLVVVVLVALKIFAPDTYESASKEISSTTGLDKDMIDENINKAKEMAVEGAEKFTDAAKEKIDN